MKRTGIAEKVRYLAVWLTVACMLLCFTGAVAESTDLSAYLTAVSITGAEKDDSGVYQLISGRKYMLDMSFAESSANQFINTGEWMIMPLNAAISATAIEGTLDVNVSDGENQYTVRGNEYVIENNQLKFRWNTSDPNFPHLAAAGNAKFHITAEASFDKNATMIPFNDNVTINVNVDDVHDVTAVKDGYYSTEDGKIHYTVRVTSTGNNTNVTIQDTLQGEALIFNKDVTATPAAAGSPQYTDKGFTWVVPSMADGDVYTFTYTADIKTDGLTGYGTVAQTGNRVTIHSDENEEEKSSSKSFENQIKYSTASKSAGHAVDGEQENTKIIPWTLKVNPEALSSLAGKTITDRIDTNSQDIMSYTGDVSVDVYRKDGTLVETRTLPLAELGGDGKTIWTYTVPETDGAYYYEFSYNTLVDVSDLKEDRNLVNHYEGSGIPEPGTSQTGIGPGEEDRLDIVKTALDYDTNGVSWSVTLNIPRKGLVNPVFEDNLGMFWAGDHAAYDNLVEGSISVTDEDGSAIPFVNASTAQGMKLYLNRSTLPAENEEWTLPGNGVSQKAITILYKTTMSEEWKKGLSESAAGSAYQHKNEAVIKSKNYPDTSSSVQLNLAKAMVDKQKAQYWANESYPEGSKTALPFYVFSVDIAGDFRNGLSVEDTFDTSILRYIDAWRDQYGNMHSDIAARVIGRDAYTVFANTAKSVDVSETADGIILSASADMLPRTEAGALYNMYQVQYTLAVKDEAALLDLAQRAAVSQEHTYAMTNKAVSQDMEDSEEVSYTYKGVNKRMVTQAHEITTESPYADYEIDLNPRSLRLNGGEPYVLTDKYENQSVLYDTVEAFSVDADGKETKATEVFWDFNGNLAMFTVPDEKHIVIRYRARVVGSGKLVMSNVAEANGEKSEIKQEVTINTSGSGTASTTRIQVLKYEAGNMSKRLAGAVFALYKADGTPVTDKDGNQVTVTTDEEGIAVVSGDADRDKWFLEENKGYYLQEIKSPDGYRLIDYKAYFTISEMADYDRYIYFNNDIMTVKNYPGFEVLARKWVLDEEKNKNKPDAGAFTFTIRAGKVETTGEDGNVEYVTDTLAEAIIAELKDTEKTIAVDANGEAVFSLPLILPDDMDRAVLHFEICEEVPEDAVDNVKDGIRYDAEPHKVTVTAVRGEDRYEITVEYVDSEAEDAAEFINAVDIVRETTAQIEAKKVLSEGTLAADQFTFVLLDRDGKEIQRKKNQADGRVVFDLITYSDTGTFTYTVKEEIPSDTNGLVYDAHAETVTVTVTADADTRELSAEVTYDTNGAVFTNVPELEFQKKIMDTNDSTGETSGWQDSADYDIGDLVPYRLTTRLPANVDAYGKYHLTFVDRMEDSLTNAKDYTVNIRKKGGEFIPLSGVTRSVNDGDHSFELTLEWTAPDESLREAEIEVLFHATLNENARFGSEGNVNWAKLRYSNDSSDNEGKKEGETGEDFVICFTYRTEISKLDENKDPLEGAVFTLEKRYTDNTWREAGSASVTGNRFLFKGIDDGMYRLVETQAPEGYETVGPLTFTVTADHSVVWEDERKRTEVLTGLAGENTSENDLVKGVVLSAESNQAGLTGSIINVREVSGAIISKVLDGNDTAEWTDTSFEFQLVLKNGSALVSGEFKALRGQTKEKVNFVDGQAVVYLKADETLSLELPVGYMLTATEKDYTEDGFEAVSPASLTVGKEGKLEFVNTRNTFGKLQIKKVLEGNDTEPDRSFDMELELRGNNLDSIQLDPSVFSVRTRSQDAVVYAFTLTGNTTREVELPNGVSYEVREVISAEEGYRLTYQNENGTIVGGAAEPVLVTVTNTRNSYGSLSVTKELEGLAAEQDRAFHFTVMFTGAESLTDSFTGTTGSAAPDTLTFAAGKVTDTFELRGGETRVYTGIPAGVIYEVTEDDYSQYGYQTKVVGNTGRSVSGTIVGTAFDPATAAVDTKNDVKFINTRDAFGSLRITKTVSGNYGETDKEFHFTVEANVPDGKYGDVTFKDGKASFTLKDQGSVEIQNLPHGTEYTVSENEANADDYVTTFQLIKGSVKGEAAKVNSLTDTIDSEVANTVNVVNQKNAYGGLIIEKQTKGNDPDKRAWFAFKVTLTGNGVEKINGRYGDVYFSNGVSVAPPDTTDVDYLNGVVPEHYFKVMKGEPVMITGLPAGLRYTVVEDDYWSVYDEADSSRSNTSGLIRPLVVNCSGEDAKTAVTRAMIESDTYTFDGTTHNNRAVFINSRTRYGKLVIRKAVQGEGADPDKVFAVRVTMKDKDGNALNYLDTVSGVEFRDGKAWQNEHDYIELKAGGSLTIQGLPLGASFEVTEDDYTQDGFQAPVYQLEYREKQEGVEEKVTVTENGVHAGTIEEDQRTVSITNSTSFGSLKISKSVLVNGQPTEGRDADGVYTFILERKNDEGIFEPVRSDVTIEILNGVTAGVQVDNLVPGTYRVREDTARNPEGMKLVGGDDFAVTVEVAGNNTASIPTAEFTNDRSILGSLSLTKRLAGGIPENLKDTLFSFTITLFDGDRGISGTFEAEGVDRITEVVFTDGRSQAIELKADETLTVKGLPQGAVYTVTEAKPDSVEASWENGKNSGTISSTAEEKVVCVNATFGSLQVLKTLKGNDVEPEHQFHLVLKLTDPEGKTLSGTFGGTVFTEGRFEFDLRGGQSRVFTGLPNGTRYTVEEAVSNEEKAYVSIPASGVIAGQTAADAAPQLAEVVNTRSSYGGLVITKQFAGNDMTEYADKAFLMSVTFTGPADMAGQTWAGLAFTARGDQAVAFDQFNLKKDEKKVYLGLPHGISYEVTETDPGDGVTVTLTNASGKIIQGVVGEVEAMTEARIHESNRVTVTNTRSGAGTLVLLKKSEGNAAKETDEFEFKVQLDLTSIPEGFTAGTYGDMTFDASGKAIVIMKAGEIREAEGLPNGARYRITETDSCGYVPTPAAYIEGTIETDKPSTAEFTNTLDQYGALSIEKKTAGNDADKETWFEFRVTVYTPDGQVDTGISGTYGEIVFDKGVSVSRTNDPVAVSSSDKRHEGWFTVQKTDADAGTKPVRIVGLPAGSRYAVEEYDCSATYPVTETMYADGTIEAVEALSNLTADAAKAYAGELTVPESNQAVFTNYRDVVGKLEILKDADVGKGEDGSRKYVFTVTLTDEKGNALAGTFSDVEFNAEGKATIELKAGESKTLEQLPKGTKFTVTEELDTAKEGFEDPRYELEYMKDGVSVKSETSQGTIDSSDTRLLTVHNRTSRGSLKLTKSVLVNGEATETTLADGDYPIKVTNEYGYEKTVVLTVKDGKAVSETLENLVPAVYTVQEDANLPDRMVEVRPEDAEKDGYKVTVKAGETAEQEIVNNLVYAGNLRLGKKVVGTGDRTKDFRFEITLKDAAGTPVSGEFLTDRDDETVTFDENGKAEVTLKAGQTLVIRNIPAGTVYEVREVKPAKEDGYTYPEESRKGSIQDAKTADEIFENIYRTSGTYVVSGTKKIEGDIRALKEDEFKFVLSRKTGEDKLEDVEVTANKEDGTFTFTDLKFTATDLLKDDKGLYAETVLMYTVREMKGEDKSITYDDAEFDVELTLKDNGQGKIDVTAKISRRAGEDESAAEDTQATESEAAAGTEAAADTGETADTEKKDEGICFVNTYAPKGTYRPEVTKTLLGRSMTEEDVFEAELLDAEGHVLETAKADWHTGRILFTAIEYTLEDMDTEEGKPVKTEKVYTFREKAGSDDEILYDTRTCRVTVTLEDNGAGELTATPAFEVIGKDGKAVEAEKAEFVNRAMQELRVSKKLSGFSGADTAFSFNITLADAENTGMTGTFPVRVVREKTGAEDEVIREEVLEIREAKLGGSIRLKAGETAVIGKLPYGTTYEIMEKDAAGYVRDGQKGDNGTVTSGENRAVFTNKADTDSLTLQKLIYIGDKVLDENEHKKAAEQSFLFTVELTGLADMSEDRPVTAVYMDSEGKKKYEEQVIFHADKTGSRLTAEGIALSHKEKVEITGIPVGATYKVTEAVPVDAKGDPIQAYTSVLSSLEGVMVKTNASGQTNEVVWKNQYVSRGRLQLSAEKLVNSRVPKQDGEYTFVLENHPDKRFENTKKVHLEATDKEGKVLFGALDYTLEDDGQRYGYRVFEKAGDRSDMVYDSQVFTVEVYVEDDGCGNMITRVTRLDEEENETDIIFRNTEVDKLIFTKKIEGGRADDIFYFDVKLSQNGKELEEAVTVTLSGKDGKEISTGRYRSGQTIEVKADQTVMLSGVPTGTEYVITEDRDGRYTTKVDGKASRAVSGTVGSGKADHVFVNTQVNTKFSVSKVWADGTNGPISLVMYANDEIMDPQPEVTRSGNTYTVENLPRYDRDGNVVTYSAKEKRVSGYVAGYSNVGDYAGRNRAAYDGGTITNSQATSMTVRKVWSGLREGEKAPEIELTLLVNGDVYYTGKRTPDANGYYHWYNLPLTWNGQKAVYTVVETEIPGFVVRYENYGNVSNVTSCAYDGGTITNTAIPKTGDTQPIALWIILAVLSLAGLTGIMVTSRRRT